MITPAKKRIRPFVESEMAVAEKFLGVGDADSAFRSLERAHVLGQTNSYDHTRVHWRMLRLGWKTRNWREVRGQLLRIIGASTKTPFGIYPKGNTGGSNVSPFRSMPIPEELQEIISEAESK